LSSTFYTIKEAFMKQVRILMRLSLGLLLALFLASQGLAQEKKKAAKVKEDRVSGTVQMINKDTSTLTVRSGNLQRQVVYNADTKFTKVNKPGSLDEVKEGVRVICLGKYNDKVQLVATRIDVRLPR
jgi:hypothetical protein